MCGKDNEHVNRAPPIRRLLAAAALDDGRDGLDHAWHRRGHGRLVGQLPCARVDPSPAGYCDSDPGCRSLREPAPESAAAVSGHDVARGASGGNGVRTDDVWFDVRSPTGWLGDAVGSALSHCPLWVPASAFYPSA